MAKAKLFDLTNPKELRKKAGENQQVFWSRFGATQSGGSRYESGRALPLPTQKLMRLYLTGKVSDTELAKT